MKNDTVDRVKVELGHLQATYDGIDFTAKRFTYLLRSNCLLQPKLFTKGSTILRRLNCSPTSYGQIVHVSQSCSSKDKLFSRDQTVHLRLNCSPKIKLFTQS